jgi:hypothetical protein
MNGCEYYFYYAESNKINIAIDLLLLIKRLNRKIYVYKKY